MGRKRKIQNSDEDASTKPVRVSGDLGTMIAWIAEIEGISTQQLLDGLLRAPITARFARIRQIVTEVEKYRNETKSELASEEGEDPKKTK